MISIKEQEKILERLDPDFKKLNARDISDLISKKAGKDEMKTFKSMYKESMRLATDSELLLQTGRFVQAAEMLEFAISRGYFGNEYLYGLLGDVYQKRGDVKKALEMYVKSGSIDSLSKAGKLE
jgi:tetratricopeptide (TPR) repeat protein